MSSLTIVTYHYVRDLGSSKYPRIKGLDLKKFINQIEYFENIYKFVSVENVIDYIYYEEEPPSNPILLTFDDGYIDHYRHVFPLLQKKKIPGSFFPAAKPIMDHVVLDVNKIHFILASSNAEEIKNYVFNFLDEHRSNHYLKSNKYYYDNLAPNARAGTAELFDNKDTIFIKRMLQSEIPDPLRKKVIDNLFKKYVTNDEASFSNELYMNKSHLKEMIESGMYIGNHGYSHKWMDSISEQDQIEEIEKSLMLLDQIGSDVDQWVMCYPYGRYNQSLINVIKSRGCKLGLTINSGVSVIDKKSAFMLNRIDTNHFT